MYLDTQPAQREYRNDPLTMADILLERVRFEEARRYSGQPRAPLPAPLPKKVWQMTPATLHVFARQSFKRTLSVMTP